MKVKLWGTRGSTPTPSTQEFQTSRYGGDTTCVSIQSGNHFMILDGGSGLRLLGLDMGRHLPKPIKATMLFSHVHWDHIQGFPFFIPGFSDDTELNLYGPSNLNKGDFIGSMLARALRLQQDNLNFPVQLKEMPAQMNFQDLLEESETVFSGGETELVVKAYPLNHPGGCFGYRIEEWRAGKHQCTFGFATDSEHLEDINPNVQKIIESADLAMLDCQYTPDEYAGINGNFCRIGWGHSTWEMSLREARAAETKHLLLHHHDPMHDDQRVAEIEHNAREAATETRITIEAAEQFKEFEI
ncbi:MAG: MBL fold metallo-hydrolase [Verrucomicrobiota bacterium]